MPCSICGTSINLRGSLPENEPLPWAPFPPYVSTIIFLPVNPVSPFGPPITNLPVGLIKYSILLSLKIFLNSGYFSKILGKTISLISV